MTTAYIAGPMRNYPRFNFDMFMSCAEYLHRAHPDWFVLNPAQHDIDNGFDPDLHDLADFDMESALHWDLAAVLAADTIVMLPGWQRSEGASLEFRVAKATGKVLRSYHPDAPEGVRLGWVSASQQTLNMVAQSTTVAEIPARETVLEEAARLISSDRNLEYGHPYDDFTCTAKLWSTWCRRKHDSNFEFEAEDVAHLMMLLKLSRAAQDCKRDTIVDIAGYAGTIEMLWSKGAA